MSALVKEKFSLRIRQTFILRMAHLLLDANLHKFV